MKHFQGLLVTLLLKHATAATVPPIRTSSTSHEDLGTPVNKTALSRDVKYAHGICNFHATVIQNCCSKLPTDGPRHAGYVDILNITDGKGQIIQGITGDIITRHELHKCGSSETGPTNYIYGMEFPMTFKWHEWYEDGYITRQKMAYQYGGCTWDEGVGGTSGTAGGSQTGDCPEYKPWCRRGDWTAGGTCLQDGHPYRRTHDMDCGFAC